MAVGYDRTMLEMQYTILHYEIKMLCHFLMEGMGIKENLHIFNSEKTGSALALEISAR